MSLNRWLDDRPIARLFIVIGLAVALQLAMEGPRWVALGAMALVYAAAFSRWRHVTH